MRIDAAVGLARQRFTPEVLFRILQRNRFQGAVVSALTSDPSETDWLLDLAQGHSWILGVVACGEGITPSRLDAWQAHSAFKGVWLRPSAVPVSWLDELAARALAVDLVVHPPELAAVARLASGRPSLRLAVARLAQPDPGGDFLSWAASLEHLARSSPVLLHLAGIWSLPVAARPHLVRGITAFGLERSMFGSDWPRCAEQGTWKQSLAAFTQTLGARTLAVRDRILGGNAARHYRLAATE